MSIVPVVRASGESPHFAKKHIILYRFLYLASHILNIQATYLLLLLFRNQIDRWDGLTYSGLRRNAA